MRNPYVPETLEGWAVLHQMFRVRWASWKALAADRRRAVAAEAAALFEAMPKGAEGSTALATMLGHKGDLMLLHFRRDFERLTEAEQALAQTALFDHLEPTTSYVSFVELGLYDMTGKLHDELKGRGLEPGTDDYHRAFDVEIGKQRDRMMGRLYPEVPARRHVCF